MGPLLILESSARFFKNSKTHNGVLAQLMNGKNNVRCNEETSACHYLNAIAAARSNNNESAIENLAKAINLEGTYKDEAVRDLEFIKLRNNSSFIEVTKE